VASVAAALLESGAFDGIHLFRTPDPIEQQVGGYIPGFRSQRFPNAPVGLAFAGDPGYPSAGINSNFTNFAPRAGFSWSAIQGKHPTTVRGAWGLFYLMPFVRLYNNFVQKRAVQSVRFTVSACPQRSLRIGGRDESVPAVRSGTSDLEHAVRAANPVSVFRSVTGIWDT